MSLEPGLRTMVLRVVSHIALAVTWMTLYFSLGVWFSLALVHAPVLHPVRNGDGARGRTTDAGGGRLR